MRDAGGGMDEPMSTATIAAPCPHPQQDLRLGLGLLVSIGLHLAVLGSFAPAIPRFVEPQPLEVEIRREGAGAGTELAAEPQSELAAAAAAPAAPAEVPVPAVSTTPPNERHAPVELGMSFDKYYTARELDQRAAQSNDVQLVYPKTAYEMRIMGRVRLKILISEHGAIDAVSILEAEPAGVFEESALAATRALQFSPAVKDGRNVKSQKVIEVVFNPYESINIP